ncbi:MAG: hypothetical protein GC145_08895 [Caulobacter sp.]|nr:hypothetical protein [Caulobacter sp.]
MNNHRGSNARPARQQRYNGPRARAGLLATPQMNFGSLINAEAILFAGGVNLAPMSLQPETLSQVVAMGTISFLPTAGLADIKSGKLAGVVVPGDQAEAGSDADVAMGEIIKAAAERQLPVMAFGDGVARTLATLNQPVPDDLPAGLLFHQGLVALDNEDDLRAAVKVFH